MNKSSSSFFVCVAHAQKKKKPAAWKVVHSVQYFCYGLWISQEMKEIRLEGAADGKTPSYLERCKHRLSFCTLKYTRRARAGAHARTHTHALCFQFAIRAQCGELFTFSLRCPFVFGIKVPPCHKSQILYDIVEIALSKMQSAKAAWSADELPWLRERQWLDSFAPIGSIQDEHLGDLEESRLRPPPPPKYEWINILRSRAHLGGSSENLTACWGCRINPNIYIRTERRVFRFSLLTEMMTHTFVTATTKVLSLEPILSFDMILRSGKKKDRNDFLTLLLLL